MNAEIMDDDDHEDIFFSEVDEDLIEDNEFILS
jgi:hypothetical protein